MFPQLLVTTLGGTFLFARMGHFVQVDQGAPMSRRMASSIFSDLLLTDVGLSPE